MFPYAGFVCLEHINIHMTQKKYYIASIYDKKLYFLNPS